VAVQNALGEAAGALSDAGGAAEVALFGGVRDETEAISTGQYRPLSISY